MSSARDVKNRIKSVKNIAQITRALEAVSASRVRRAQERVLASRDYAEKAWEILLHVQAATGGQVSHPLLAERETIDNTLIVVITSDRGLAGSYNTNVLRVAQRYEQQFDGGVKYVAVGRKGRDSLIRQGKEIVAEFSDLPAAPTIADISPITQICIDEFLSGNVDEVLIAYTDFINMLTQSPVILGWLPLTPSTTANQVAVEYVKHVPEMTEGNLDYEFEPNAAALLDEIVPRFTELQLYQALLESQASEHAARMTAMRNATDNASGLVDDLTLEYNKARQSAITSEILDIVGGANALEATVKQKAAAKKKNKAPQSTTPTQPAAAPAVAAALAEADDLTRIEGIGPKMSAALQDAGLMTYEAVASSSMEQLRAAIESAGMRLAPSMETWSEQAALAAKGDWDSLQALQDTLVSGRRPD